MGAQTQLLHILGVAQTGQHIRRLLARLDARYAALRLCAVFVGVSARGSTELERCCEGFQHAACGIRKLCRKVVRAETRLCEVSMVL